MTELFNSSNIFPAGSLDIRISVIGLGISLIFAMVLSVLLITISYLISVRGTWDAEKLSPYECGFEPYGDARQKFDIRYYLVSLLFILFDLEVSYLFPFFVVLGDREGYIIATIFVVVLTIGFIYEWSKGALDNI